MRTRRKFTSEFKSRVVLELLSGERPVTEACREYDLTAQMVNDWKAQFLAAAPQVFEKGAPSSGEAERIAELEQMVGKLTMQLEIAKKASRLLDGTSRRNGRRS
jgi:transposase-like protein